MRLILPFDKTTPARFWIEIVAVLLVAFILSWSAKAWAADPIDWSKPYARMNVGIAGAGVAAAAATPCSGTDSYIGWTDLASASEDSGNAGYTQGNSSAELFSVAGTGTVRVCSLTAYVRSAGGTHGHCRMAIYTGEATNASLVCYGQSEFEVSSTTQAWMGHTSYTDITPAGGSAGDACNLTKGTGYVLLMSCDANDTKQTYKTQTGVVSSNASHDFTNTAWETPHTWNAGGSIGWRIRIGYQ